MANMSPEDFIRKEIAKLKPQAIVVGEDFRFGKDKLGDAKLLQKSVNTSVVPIVKNEQNLKISSSQIRQFLEQGDVENANKMLGYNYFLTSKIIHGLGIGAKFKFPTANLHIPNLKLLPEGVFAGITHIDNKKYLSAISVGYRQTLDKELKLCCESHILDFKQDIYHKEIKLEFVHKIRDQKKFESLELLFQQVEEDVEEIRRSIISS